MLIADTASIASRIEQAFQSASTSTGTSFDYLVKTAARESSFNPTAKAATSSATGLFQFIESTWLETMKEAGPKHGLEKYSDQIQRTSSGKYRVSDPAVRQEILDLRKDPDIASVMAGALTQKNAAHLSRKLGRQPSEGELYMAHFLGAGGANRLIRASEDNAEMRADKLFPSQARANKSIFYHSNGEARTTSEVYDVITSKHSNVTMIASAVQSGGRAPSLNDVAALPNQKPGAGGDSLEGGEDLATQRVVNAFRATETADPFEALFRTGNTFDEKPLGSRFSSAFTAVEQASAFSALGASDAKVAAQQLASLGYEGPLDLTRFLSYREDREQNDLLPPA
ncbi:transglycosylase SLT domain-containing protein [Roseibium polysiphoniae]|uniref:transglycosylase SLT domain-containing protein n=1 Tax=Roseibium polysiphoniae TaxID=2571221 RepID=UPI0032988BB7